MDKQIIFLFFIYFSCHTLQAQKLMLPTTGNEFDQNNQNYIIPGSTSLNRNHLNSFNKQMTCYAINDGKKQEIAKFIINVIYSEKKLSVYTYLESENKQSNSIDTTIADASTFKPIYRSSYNSNREMVVRYNKEITGHYLDKKSNKKIKINLPMDSTLFDSYLYPYILGALPLTQNYKAKLPVYDFATTHKKDAFNAVISDVRSSEYQSQITGDHKVWQIDVFEESSGEKYVYFLDKESKRTWRIDIMSNGQLIMLIDDELDFNPFKTVLNKSEALKLITAGKSAIKGQAFARDNQSGIRGVALLNVNKKQYAASGINIFLIPYTPYFKEWVMINKNLAKKGRSFPMSKDAVDCLKVTQVKDEEGHFEFTRLLPGEYLLYTEFEYAHEATYTETVGYTDVYINETYQGSNAMTRSHNFVAAEKATLKKVVKISKDGENVSVKLKKTL